MNLGENIYHYRTDHNMSQEDLAEALNVSRQSVSKWENNNAVPDLDKLVKMAELFGVTLDELVSGKSPAPPQPVPAESKPRFSRRATAGILFFCAAALIFLYYALRRQADDGFLAALPFGLCGALCFTKVHHVVLWCVWIFILPLMAVPLFSVPRYSFVIWAGLYLPMSAGTVWCLRHDPVAWSKKTALFLILGYVICFAWLLNRIFGLVEISFYYGTIAHWIDVCAFLIFTSVVSVSLRLLKKA